MFDYSKVLLLSLAFVVSGCSMKYPQNPTEFRQMLPGSMFGEVEKFEVNQPISRIARVFKARANTCLNKSIKTQSCMQTGYGGMSCSVTVIHYKPTVKTSAQAIELHLQQKSENFLTLGKIPEDGIYTLVADVRAKGKNTSELVIYSGSFGSDTLKKAIRAWASGKSRGCPDLAQG